MIGLRIYKKEADKIRQRLIKDDQIDFEHKLHSDEKYVYIPLVTGYNQSMIDDLASLDYVTLGDYEFTKVKHRARNFLEYLEDVDDEDIEKIRKSFDIIGEVVIIEISDELLDKKYDIGRAVLKFTKRRSVYYKKSKVKGVTRTRDLEYLAGDEELETIHKEYGIRFKLDPSKVYFSPRLATERERIVKQVADGEVIIDFFAGIGSFAISIAHKKNATIYSVDINPEAIKYAKENVKLNKLVGEVIPIESDINDVIDELPLADRILMNLPGTSIEFLDTAVNHLKKGGILNYYEFASEYETVINHIDDACKTRDFEVLDIRKVKSQSPGIWHIGVDVKIE